MWTQPKHTALHQQSSNESEYAGHQNKDVEHNYNVIGKFNYEKGHTLDSQYETVFDLNLMQIEVKTCIKRKRTFLTKT